MKRIVLVVAAIAAIATTAVWFAAEESYVTTVDATIGTSLNVSSHGSQNYGLVFGQEERVGSMSVEINSKAKLDSNLTSVTFDVACNDGASGAAASSICPNLTISPLGSHLLETCDSQGLPTGCGSQVVDIEWTFVAPDCEGAAQKKVNPKTVGCDQDNNWQLSGEVSIDVTGRTGSVKELVCNKKTDTFFNLTTGVDTGISCQLGQTQP